MGSAPIWNGNGKNKKKLGTMATDCGIRTMMATENSCRCRRSVNEP